ncbi:MAG: TetR family transcriptional regulator [Pseudomonadota bacterium]
MVALSERDRATTEERLKEAAIAVWSRHGFDGSSVKDIAEAAEANVSLVSRYFGGKEGLLLTILNEMIVEKQEGQLDYAPQETLEAEAFEYLRHRYRSDMESEAFIRVVISKIVVDRGIREQALTSLTYASDENFRQRLSTLQSNGKIREDADLTMIFRQIGLISFSASLTEGIILEKSKAETEKALQEAAAMIGLRFGRI